MVTLYSQLLLKSYRGQLDGEAATFTAVITEGTDRRRALLADLLAYTQLTADGEKDNGVGIGPEYHKKISGVFKRLHGTDIAGTGIGLAICQRVVERYGGAHDYP